MLRVCVRAHAHLCIYVHTHTHTHAHTHAHTRTHTHTHAHTHTRTHTHTHTRTHMHTHTRTHTHTHTHTHTRTHTHTHYSELAYNNRLLCSVAIAMSELLFECFSAPSVAYGVDALFSYQYNCMSPANDGMYIIHCE